jgi:hypothetical protein
MVQQEIDGYLVTLDNESISLLQEQGPWRGENKGKNRIRFVNQQGIWLHRAILGASNSARVHVKGNQFDLRKSTLSFL